MLDINDKKITLNKNLCDLSVIYKRTINNLKDQIELNKLNIKYEIQDGIKEFNADLNKISKIFEVLLKNAVLYSEIKGEILISIKQDNGQLSIDVTDHGIGITEEEKIHIFEQFYRSDRAKLKLPDGLGLGMFIAKTFIEYHGGVILVESAGVGMGTKIGVILPIE